MKKLLILSGLILSIFAVQLSSCHSTSAPPVERIKQQVAQGLNDLSGYIADSMIARASQDLSREEWKNRLIRARTLYKRLEWAAEYFFPTTTRFVNGPPVPEIEAEENKMQDAEGLQVIEEMLWNEEPVDRRELERQCRLLLSYVKTYSSYWEAIDIDSAQVLDAVRLQVFRITALGMAGFDAPLAQTSLEESAESLTALRAVMRCFAPEPELEHRFETAINTLRAPFPDEAFDRLQFIREQALPLSRALLGAQQKWKIAFANDRRLLRPDAATLFDANAFDPNAYSPDSAYFISPQKTALGKKLFYDPILSIQNQRNCASCHDPSKAFTDGLRTSAALSKGFVQRNAPTLLNAALQPGQFYDLRATNLENQSRTVIQNKEEMHGDLKKAAELLQRDETYRGLFRLAFKSDSVTETGIQNAIASYVRSLTFLNSRFDRYMRGEQGAMLTAEEKSGFNLFVGKARCGSCHFMPLFNGTVPPAFLKMESEVLGVPRVKNGREIDPDEGRFSVVHLPPYRNAFKTTTVRNVARTAPYMHNGAFDSLEEVIDFYDRGGGAGMGIPVTNQTLPAAPLHLTEEEKHHLLAFLRSLNDEVPQQ